MTKLQGPFPAPAATVSRAPTLEDTGYASQSGKQNYLLNSCHNFDHKFSTTEMRKNSILEENSQIMEVKNDKKN